MLIPYQYNKMATGAVVIDPNRASYGIRGVFTFLQNGSCNQSGMTMPERYLISGNVSRMEIFSGGTALQTTVNYGAGVFVQSGGVLSSTVVNSNGNIQVSSGGTAVDTELNYSGQLHVSNGGAAQGGHIHSGGRVYASADALVGGFHLSTGAGLYGKGANVTFDRTVISIGADFSAGQFSEVNVLHTTITPNASFWCHSGMNVTHTTVMSNAMLHLSSGAKCFDVILEAGGKISHGVWGHDSETEVTGSNQYGSFYTRNGTACNYVLASGQNQQLFYYASALSTLISSGGTQFVSFGAVAQYNTILSQGRQIIFSGGMALDTVISSGGNQFADFFGTAIRTTVGSYAWLYVTNFGRAISTTIEQGGSGYCSYGGQMTSTLVSGWQMFSNGGGGTHVTVANTGAVCYLRYACYGSDFNVADGGTLGMSQNCEITGVNVSNGGCLELYSMCLVANLSTGSCSINAGGYCTLTSVLLGGTLEVSNYCSLSDLQINSGGVVLMQSSQCRAMNVHISKGGSFYLSSYNFATNVTVDSGGLLFVASGASALAVTSSAGANITLETGGFIEYV